MDILVRRTESNFELSVYHKPTNKNALLHIFFFHEVKIKINKFCWDHACKQSNQFELWNSIFAQQFQQPIASFWSRFLCDQILFFITTFLPSIQRNHQLHWCCLTIVRSNSTYQRIMKSSLNTKLVFKYNNKKPDRLSRTIPLLRSRGRCLQHPLFGMFR